MHLFLLSRYYTLCCRPVVSAGLACMALVTSALFMASAILAGTVYRDDRGRLRALIGQVALAVYAHDRPLTALPL